MSRRTTKSQDKGEKSSSAKVTSPASESKKRKVDESAFVDDEDIEYDTSTLPSPPKKSKSVTKSKTPGSIAPKSKSTKSVKKRKITKRQNPQPVIKNLTLKPEYIKLDEKETRQLDKAELENLRNKKYKYAPPEKYSEKGENPLMYDVRSSRAMGNFANSLLDRPPMVTRGELNDKSHSNYVVRSTKYPYCGIGHLLGVLQVQKKGAKKGEKVSRFQCYPIDGKVTKRIRSEFSKEKKNFLKRIGKHAEDFRPYTLRELEQMNAAQVHRLCDATNTDIKDDSDQIIPLSTLRELLYNNILTLFENLATDNPALEGKDLKEHKNYVRELENDNVNDEFYYQDKEFQDRKVVLPKYRKRVNKNTKKVAKSKTQSENEENNIGEESHTVSKKVKSNKKKPAKKKPAKKTPAKKTPAKKTSKKAAVGSRRSSRVQK